VCSSDLLDLDLMSHSSRKQLLSSQGGAEYNSDAGVLGSSSVRYESEQRRVINLPARAQYSFQRVNYGLDFNNSYRHFMGSVWGAHSLCTSLQRGGPQTEGNGRARGRPGAAEGCRPGAAARHPSPAAAVSYAETIKPGRPPGARIR
jgi:hypothetical protein